MNFVSININEPDFFFYMLSIIFYYYCIYLVSSSYVGWQPYSIVLYSLSFRSDETKPCRYLNFGFTCIDKFPFCEVFGENLCNKKWHQQNNNYISTLIDLQSKKKGCNVTFIILITPKMYLNRTIIIIVKNV